MEGEKQAWCEDEGWERKMPLLNWFLSVLLFGFLLAAEATASACCRRSTIPTRVLVPLPAGGHVLPASWEKCR